MHTPLMRSGAVQAQPLLPPGGLDWLHARLACQGGMQASLLACGAESSTMHEPAPLHRTAPAITPLACELLRFVGNVQYTSIVTATAWILT